MSYQGPDDAAPSVGSATYEYTDPEHAHAPTVVPHGIVPTDADRKTAQYDGSGAITALTESAGDGAGTEEFAYDGFGRYSRVTTAEDTEEYVYDASGLRVALLTDAAEGKKSTLTFGPVTISDGHATLRATMPDGTALGTRSGEGWSLDWADVQGNVRSTVSAGGVVNREYLPEGAVIDASTVEPGDRGFLGKTQDSAYEVQLDHRKLSSLYRTFLSPDPLLAPFQPQTLNPYAYAQYNPTSMSDPSGLKPAGLVDMQPLATEDIVSYTASSQPNPTGPAPIVAAEPDPDPGNPIGNWLDHNRSALLEATVAVAETALGVGIAGGAIAVGSGCGVGAVVTAPSIVGPMVGGGCVLGSATVATVGIGLAGHGGNNLWDSMAKMERPPSSSSSAGESAGAARGPADSPIWGKLDTFKGKVRSNGLNGKKREYYTWDYTHNDIEIFNSRGIHQGSKDPFSGNIYKPPVKGRTLER